MSSGWAKPGQTHTDAYWAGYIDADGCIRFSGGSPRIEIKGVFPWVLDELQMEFGGSVTRIVHEKRPTFRWSISGTLAVRLLQRLLPYLYVKRAQARLVLEARQLGPGPERDGLVAQIKALKHHHYEN